MTSDRELMQQALEALEEPREHIFRHRRLEAITALRERLAQPEPQAPRPDYRDWDYQDQLEQSPLDRMAENARELGLDYEPTGIAVRKVWWDGDTLRAEAIPPEQFYKQPEQEPVAWRDHVEQRMLTWRQSFVNKSGDQLALDDFMDKESLDDLIDFVCDEYTTPQLNTIANSEAIPEQIAEPVAWRNKETGEFCTGGFLRKDWARWTPLYTTPPRREWVGLTEEEIKALPQWFPSHETAAMMPLIRAIEAKLREKNA